MRTAVEAVLVAAVAALTLRRLVLLAAALAPRRSPPRPPAEWPSVTVLVAARNEAAVVDELLAALDGLEYAPDRLTFVLVCDGCTDETTASFRRWTEQRPDARALELPARVGKAAALARGLELAEGEVVVVLDADLRPQPGFVRELVPAFADERVAAAAAYLRPVNADDNVVTRYAAVTSWVHQLVTSAGADRLGLNPPTFGAAAYRRDALEAIGGFPLVPVGEDVAASRRLTRQGWRTRFLPAAVADNTVVSTLTDYWQQHVRWARGAFGVAGPAPSRFEGTAAQRVESWASTIGYGDRLVFALAVAGALAGLHWWLPVAYFAAPGAEVVVASLLAGARRELPRALLATVVLFAADLLASVAAVVAHVARRPHRWHSPRGLPADSGSNR